MKTSEKIPVLRLSKGFTLLEILLAVFIFGIVMVTIFGSFNAIFGNVEEIDRKAAQHEMVKTTLDRLSEDLTSIYLTHFPLYAPSEEEQKQDLYRVIGGTRGAGSTSFSYLRFTSNAHLPSVYHPQRGIAQIIYYVQPIGNDQYVLKRSDGLYPYDAVEDYDFEQNTADPVVCRSIRTFSVLYIDDEGEEFEAWDSESEEFDYGTPRAVKIKMTIGNDDQTVDAGTMVLLPVFREKKES